MNSGTGLAFARVKAVLFIKKFMLVDLKEAEPILPECTAQESVVTVGCALRFPKWPIIKCVVNGGQIGRPLSLQASVGSFLPEYRPGSDYTKSISARRELSGGVIFVLSHKLDYARWLMDDPSLISAMTATVAGVPIDVEDMADTNLQFLCGTSGSIQMDMIDRVLCRGCRVSGSDGTLLWEFTCKHRVSLWQETTGKGASLFDDAGYDY